jgi:lipooligosaccharide transport system ATP-binding protein
MFWVLGPNGAGKTSTMKMISAAHRYPQDRSMFWGWTWFMVREVKRRIGVVTQDNDLDPDLTVMQNLALYASFFGLSRRRAIDRAHELLAFVQLEDKAKQYVRSCLEA